MTDIVGTRVLEKQIDALKSDKRFILHRGGSRSTKTYSIIQSLIILALQESVEITIIRKTLPALRDSAMKDFISILRDQFDLFDERNFNRTQLIYTFDNGSTVKFLSCDNANKLRGLRHDYCWLEEATEFEWDDYIQLAMRTTNKLIFSYNPSEQQHWLYDLATKDNAVEIHSSYKDNPFLSQEQIEQIESLPEFEYRVFGLGERGVSPQQIFKDFKLQPVVIDPNLDWCYGMDFGFEDPSALVVLQLKENTLYIKELLYEQRLTGNDIVTRLADLKIDKKKLITADNARPEHIQEITRAGYNVIPCTKGPGSILAGIIRLKRYELVVDIHSANLIRELNGYKWKKNGEKIMDEPIMKDDHTIDAIRYGLQYLSNVPKKTSVLIGGKRLTW
jgi:phage terminase large subunit